MPRTTTDPSAEALSRVDSARSHVTRWIVVAAAVEAILLAGFIIVADFTDRTHVLLLIGCLLVYLTLGFGLLALAAFTRWWALRIIAALSPRAAGEID